MKSDDESRDINRRNLHVHSVKKEWMAVWAVLFLVLIVSCSKESVNPEFDVPDTPEQLNDGWPVSSLLEQGMHPFTIDTLSQRIRQGDYGYIHSLLIVRYGTLIFEEYYRNYHVDRLHNIYSVTKSITSALIGKAIEEGHIAGIDVRIADFFPEYEDIIQADPRKQNITLRHLLTMTSGLEYDETTAPYDSPNNTWNQMHDSDDWVRFVLELPMVEEPGRRFNYNSGCTILLAAILKKTTGRHADRLADDWLFGPLGITERQWSYQSSRPNDLPDTGGGLQLRPRDMAKFGQCYLDGGRWLGVQVVAEDWVTESLTAHVTVEDRVEYGYQWWSFRYFQIPEPGVQLTRYIPYAAGYSGQHIFLIPACDILIVVTASNGRDGVDFLDIIFNYIFPAVIYD